MKIADIFGNIERNSDNMDTDSNAYLLKDQYLPDFSSKSQAEDPRFKSSVDQSPSILDHVREPSRYFTPIARVQLAGDVTWRVVKPIPRHVSVVAPLQYPGRKILHPVPGFLRRHVESGPASGIDQSRLPPKKRRYIHTGDGDGPSAKVSKTVAIGNGETLGFSHSETSVFSAYRRPVEPTVPQAKRDKDTMAQATNQVSDVQCGVSAFSAYHRPGPSVSQSPDVQRVEAVAKSRETTTAHAQDVYHDDSDTSTEDDEVAAVMENSEKKKYPILGYRVVRFTTDDDNDDDGEYGYEDDEDGNGEYSGDDYDDDDEYDDYGSSDSEVDELHEIIQDLKKDGCQSPREPWLADIDINNSKAGSESMEDVVMSCFRPITPVVIRLSPDSSISDHSILATPAATDSDLSLSQFSPVNTNSGSTIGSISDFTTPPYSDRSINNHTDELSKDYMNNSPTERTEDEDGLDDLSIETLQANDEYPNDLTEETEMLLKNVEDTPGKPKMAVSPSVSMAEFRASVLVGEKLSVRRYEEWYAKSEDEKFAEILEDFLEENEGQLFDLEDRILEMLANTRDRIAEKRRGIREAGDTMAGPSRGSSEAREVMICLSRDSLMDEFMETNRAGTRESSPEDVMDEAVSTENRLCGYIAPFFGHSGCVAHLAYRRRILRTDSDQAFYDMILRQDSPASDVTDSTDDSDIVIVD